jgi:ATP-binding protein involved in chromosome partitioning
MKEKILNLIKEIDISNISKFNNLIDSNALSEIFIKDDKVSFAIDIEMLEIDGKSAQILEDKIKEKLKTITNSKVNIILTSSQKSPSDLNQPAKTPEEQIKVEQGAVKQSAVKGVKNIIVVASGKGGVGKSTVAVNLAISLKRIGFKVGLADADIYGPSITHLMNLQGKPKNEGNLMIPISNYGIDCISVGSLVAKDKAAIWRGPMITKVLTQLISGTKWDNKGGSIDYLIIDLPPGTGDVHLSLVQQFKPDGAVIVTTPQNLAIIDVIKAVDMFKTLKIPILGVVQNMAYFLGKDGEKNYIFGKDGGRKMAKDLGLKFLGDIAVESEINKATELQNPICNLNPSSEISFEFGRIAENVVDSH